MNLIQRVEAKAGVSRFYTGHYEWRVVRNLAVVRSIIYYRHKQKKFEVCDRLF
jgi:hypothetical protein